MLQLWLQTAIFHESLGFLGRSEHRNDSNYNIKNMNLEKKRLTRTMLWFSDVVPQLSHTWHHEA